MKDVVAGLLGSREGVLPAVQAFPPVDRNQIWRELRLQELAKKCAEAAHRDQAGRNLAELDIDQAIERYARKATDEYKARLQQYDARIRRANLGADQRAAIEAAGQNALSDFQAHLAEDQDELTLAMQNVRSREQEFQAFRRKHQLTRLPHAVSPRWRLYTYLVIALALILESATNGLLFAKGSAAGIVGGIGQALMLALVNVGVAAAFAVLVMPYWWHNARGMKILAAVGTAVFALWLPTWNLFIGHYRDFFIETEGAVGLNVVWQAVLSHPAALRDVLSGALVAFGVVVGISVVFKLVHGTEHYPGFAAAGARRERAFREYRALKSDCIARITELRNDAVMDLEEAVELLRNSEFDRQLAIESRARLHGVYQAYLEHLSGIREWLVSGYRDACSSAAGYRNTAGAAPPLAALAGSPLPPIPEPTQDSRLAAIDRIESYIARINERFEGALQTYRPVEDLISAEHGSYATA